MPFFLHPKRFVRVVLTKVLSLLFTLTSAIFAQIRHLEDKNNRRIFASAYQKSLADKLNMLYLSGFCHSMIYPIQYSESD